MGDGKKDDTAAIKRAMNDGNRCGKNCNGSTRKNAIVYFPQGIYLVSSGIPVVFGTQLIGDVRPPAHSYCVDGRDLADYHARPTTGRPLLLQRASSAPVYYQQMSILEETAVTSSGMSTQQASTARFEMSASTLQIHDLHKRLPVFTIKSPKQQACSSSS